MRTVKGQTIFETEYALNCQAFHMINSFWLRALFHSQNIYQVVVGGSHPILCINLTQLNAN